MCGVLPSFGGLLASASSHRGEGFAACAGLACPGVGLGRFSDALGNVCTDAAGHGETVTHGWDVGLTVVCSDGLGDVVGAFVGIDAPVVFEGFAWGFEAEAGASSSTLASSSLSALSVWACWAAFLAARMRSRPLANCWLAPGRSLDGVGFMSRTTWVRVPKRTMLWC